MRTFLKGPALMMRYERFIPSLGPTGGIGAASEFSPLMLARLRNTELARQKAALDAWEDGELIAPASDVTVPEPLPNGLVAGARWCRCRDFIHP